MKSKIWIKKLLIYLTSILIFIFSFNFIVDPYGVFNIVNIEGFNKNKNYISNDARTKFYNAKRANPNVLLIGTSRTEHINPKDLAKYFPEDTNIYNLAIKGSGVTLHKKNIEYFIKNYDIDTIIYGLDLFSFNSLANRFDEELKYTRYNDYYIEDYVDILFGAKQFSRAFRTLKSNLKKDPTTIDLNTGWFDEVEMTEKIKKGGLEFLKKHTEDTIVNNIFTKSIMYNSSEFKSKNSIDKTLDTFDGIYSLCKTNNIKLHIFISPIYSRITKLIFQKGYGETYKYWKKRLSKYPGIIDFSGYNSITNNIENFVDGSHYNDNTSKIIIERLFNEKNNTIPSDFGIVLK